MDDYRFLNNLATLLAKGYTVEEALSVCREIDHHPLIKVMKQRLLEGDEITAIIETSPLPEDFLMFYRFFALKATVSEAITNALEISETLKRTKERLIKKMSYPMLLMIFLFLFSLFATCFLFPQVDQLFLSFGAKQSLLFQVLFTLIRILPLFMIILCVIVFSMVIHFLWALRFKRYMTIDRYLKIPILKRYIQKYFTLKFALFFNELVKDHLDTNMTIRLLDEHMTTSDMKIMLYEIHEKIKRGQAFEDIMRSFEYFDPLFLSLYEMYLRDPEHDTSLQTYIDLSYAQIEHLIDCFMKLTIPAVYSFVAFFIIIVYIGIIIPMMNIISDI